jgi:hypothetical protein
LKQKSKLTTPSQPKATLRHFTIFTCSISLLGLVIFNTGLRENMTMFSNDAPLGLRMAQQSDVRDTITGHWEDLNWLGGKGLSAAPTLSSFFAYICGPLLFSKLYPLLAFITLGVCTWYCMRELSFRPWICFLVGLASALNGSAFSVACWGLSSWTISRAMIFLAIGLLVPRRKEV